MNETVILRLPVRAETSFRLSGLDVDDYSWESSSPISDIVVPDGHELVLRRIGCAVCLLRRSP